MVRHSRVLGIRVQVAPIWLLWMCLACIAFLRKLGSLRWIVSHRPRTSPYSSTMADQVSVEDLDVAEKVSISGAEAPEGKTKEKKEKPKKAPKEKKAVVHGGAQGGGDDAAFFCFSLFLRITLCMCEFEWLWSDVYGAM